MNYDRKRHRHPALKPNRMPNAMSQDGPSFTTLPRFLLIASLSSAHSWPEATDQISCGLAAGELGLDFTLCYTSLVDITKLLSKRVSSKLLGPIEVSISIIAPKKEVRGGVHNPRTSVLESGPARRGVTLGPSSSSLRSGSAFALGLAAIGFALKTRVYCRFVAERSLAGTFMSSSGIAL